MRATFPDPWLANGPDRRPQQTWYGVSRSMPHAATLRRLSAQHPQSSRTVRGVGTFLGPVTRADHPTTWSHHGLHGNDDHWWCLSSRRRLRRRSAPVGERAHHRWWPVSTAPVAHGPGAVGRTRDRVENFTCVIDKHHPRLLVLSCRAYTVS